MSATSEETTQAQQIDYLKNAIDQLKKGSLRARRWWSLANHGSSICIALFSAASAAMAQAHPHLFKGWPLIGHARNIDVAAVLSLFVTVLTTVKTTVSFERKWIANRMTQGAVNRLLVDIKQTELPPDIKERVKAIIADHDNAIAGVTK